MSDATDSPAPDSDTVADAALRVAAERGWRSASLDDIAAAAGVDPTEMRRRFRCKGAVLTAIVETVERKAAAEPPDFDEEDTVRDRLFELLMQRLDILDESRDGVTSLLRDLSADPISAAAAAPAAMRRIGGILEQAGVPASGPVGVLRCKGLAAVWLAAINEWVRDDSPDHARTMATLDANLRRAEPFARFLAQFPASRSPAPGGMTG
ncbi:MAG: helix-turn-helix domain-containing protein [Pseudomonadota bacterium]